MFPTGEACELSVSRSTNGQHWYDSSLYDRLLRRAYNICYGSDGMLVDSRGVMFVIALRSVTVGANRSPQMPEQ